MFLLSSRSYFDSIDKTVSENFSGRYLLFNFGGNKITLFFEKNCIKISILNLLGIEEKFLIQKKITDNNKVLVSIREDFYEKQENQKIFIQKNKLHISGSKIKNTPMIGERRLTYSLHESFKEYDIRDKFLIKNNSFNLNQWNKKNGLSDHIEYPGVPHFNCGDFRGNELLFYFGNNICKHGDFNSTHIFIFNNNNDLIGLIYMIENCINCFSDKKEIESGIKCCSYFI